MINQRLGLAAVAMFFLATAPSMAALSPTDRTFAQQAAQGGLAEVALGQLAEQNAASQQVKDFGQKMVTDHSQANQKLQQIAQSEHFVLPSAPSGNDAALQRRLSSLKGTTFDQAYTRDMVKDHQQDIAEFRHEAQSGQDPALKSFAQETLPVLQQHLQMAQTATSQK